ncbi:MAG: HupE/UreJ family protein [Acidobacteriota bacterium]
MRRLGKFRSRDVGPLGFLGPISLLCLVCLVGALPASAHSLGESYLYLQIRDDSLSGRFEVSIGDFNHALGLEDTQWEITPDDFQRHLAILHQYYLKNVTFSHDGETVPIVWTDAGVLAAHHGYALLSFDLPSLDGAVPEVLTVDYSVLFDHEPDHRGFLLVESNWATGVFANENRVSLTFTPDERRQDFEITSSGNLRGFATVLALGVEQVLDGIERLLLVIALLLPLVVPRSESTTSGSRRPVEHLGPVLRRAAVLVTVFAVGHALATVLVAFGAEPPVRLVGVLVAATVWVAALDLLVPILRGDRVLTAAVAVFGLVHGFRFADVLADFPLLTEHRGLVLLAFALGVEIGLLVLVGVLVPLAYSARCVARYRTLALPAAAVFILLVAGVWLVERLFGVDVPMWESLPSWLQRIVP